MSLYYSNRYFLKANAAHDLVPHAEGKSMIEREILQASYRAPENFNGALFGRLCNICAQHVQETDKGQGWEVRLRQVLQFKGSNDELKDLLSEMGLKLRPNQAEHRRVDAIRTIRMELNW